MRKTSWFLLLPVLAFMSPSLARAQAVANAQIHGVVTDPTGAVVPSAAIKATQTATGMTRTTVSNSAGSYALPSLPVGPYTLSVEAAGFERYTQSGIVLQVSDNVAINVGLKVGAVSQQVSVNANAAMVQTESTAVSEVVDQRRIVDLPLNGRLATQLVVLSGAALNSPVGGDFASTKNYPGSSVISVAGGQGNGNLYLMDGATNNDTMTDVNLPYPFPDAMQEFSVQTNGLSARYGLHPGAVVNVVTKSGTNQFHGDLFEFVRNGVFNARNFFAATQDTLRRNQFGGTVGGPVKKNKVFGFFGYQGTRTRTSPPNTISFVPTAQELSGDFSAEESPACQPKGKAATLTNPSTGQPFANNFISPTLFNQTALNLLKYIPPSSDPCGKLVYGIPTIQDENQYIGRADWTISTKQSAFARYFIANYSQPAVFDGKNLLTTTQPGNLDRAQSMTLGHTYSVSANTVNSARLAWTRLRDNRGAPTNDINWGQLGADFGSYQPNKHFIQLGVGSSNSFFGVGCGTCAPGFFNGNALQLSDDVDMMHGKHHISFGANWIYNQFNSISLFVGNGSPSFNGEFTTNPLVDFLLGLPSDFSQGQPQTIYFRKDYVGAYVQDDVRASSRLNFHVGLRWEPFLPINVTQNWQDHFSIAAFRAGTISKEFVNAPAGLQFAADGIQHYYNSTLADFEPRIGFVWDPSGEGKQTIRSSYSIFYDTPETFYPDRATDEAPWTSDIDIPSPAGGLTNPYLNFPGGDPFPLPSPPTSTASFPPEGVYVNFPLNLRPTYMQQWDLSYQRQLSANWMVSATYIGNRTIHLWGGVEQDPAVDNPAVCAATPGGCSTKTTNLRRVFYLQNPAQGSKISTMAVTWDGAEASYNGLVLSAQHRFARNYTVLFNYTYSHCLSGTDFTGELTGPSTQNPYDPNTEYGNCGFDLRHNLVASLVAMSPKFHGAWTNRLLGGWQLAPIISWHTGSWFNPSTGSDRSLTGVNHDRPNLVGNPYVENLSTLEWLNPAAYALNPLGTFGNVGRNSVIGPSFFDVDTDLSRYFQMPWNENQRLELRFEFFDLGNNVEFSNPTSSFSSSTFGEIRSTSSSTPNRILQFALKYYF